MIAIANNELGNRLECGDLIRCPKCKEDHVVQAAIDSIGKPASVLWVKCGDDALLVGLSGRQIITKKKQEQET